MPISVLLEPQVQFPRHNYSFFLHHLWTHALLSTSICSLRCWAVVLMWGMQVWIQLMSFPDPGFTLDVKILHIEKVLRILERQSQTIICDLNLVLCCNILKKFPAKRSGTQFDPFVVLGEGLISTFIKVMDVLMKVCL